MFVVCWYLAEITPEVLLIILIEENELHYQLTKKNVNTEFNHITIQTENSFSFAVKPRRLFVDIATGKGSGICGKFHWYLELFES